MVVTATNLGPHNGDSTGRTMRACFDGTTAKEVIVRDEQ